MYKIIQNYLTDNDYEYAQEFQTIDEARQVIRDYENEDKKEEKYHSYTIIDNESYEDVEEQEREAIREGAIEAMRSIGLTEDEAEREAEDLKL